MRGFKTNSNFLEKLLLALVIIWLSFAFLRTIYNFSKLFMEEQRWYALSDEKKKAKLFGDLHYFFRFIERNTDRKANIIFLSPGGKSYYLARYYLYPRYLLYVKREKDLDLLIKKEKYDYLIVYKTKDKSLNENDSDNFGDMQYEILAKYNNFEKLGSEGIIYKL